MCPDRHQSLSNHPSRQDERTRKSSGQADPKTFTFSIGPFFKSGLSLVSLLLVASSAPLFKQLYLLNVIVSTINSDSRSSGPSVQGGIGIWGACLEQVNLTKTSQPRLCTFASPLSLPTISSLIVPLPTLPSYLPPYFSPVLSFFLVLALACALIQHALRSYIIWGEIVEYGHISTGGKKGDSSDKSLGYQSDTQDGLNRLGGARWKNTWETVSRELAIAGAQSCIIVIGILLFPLLPSIYILTNTMSSVEGDVVTSMLLIPGWGTALLILSVVCTLTLRPSSSRSRSRSRSNRSKDDRCHRSSMLPCVEFESLQAQEGCSPKVRSESAGLNDLSPTSNQPIHPLPQSIPSLQKMKSQSKATAMLRPSSLNRGWNQINEPKKSSRLSGFWIPVLAFADMSEGEIDSSDTVEKEGIQVVQVEVFA